MYIKQAKEQLQSQYLRMMHLSDEKQIHTSKDLYRLNNPDALATITQSTNKNQTNQHQFSNAIALE